MIRLSPCGCPAQPMARVRRAAWMRALFPNRALYDCGSCGARFLATPAHQAELGIRAFAERSQGAPTCAREGGGPRHARHSDKSSRDAARL
jgi:hypothetical protein